MHCFRHSPKIRDITTLHMHEFVEIGCCREGTGIFVIDNEVFHFKPGDIFVIFSGQLHKAQSIEKLSQWDFVYFDMQYFAKETALEEIKEFSQFSATNYNNYIGSESQSGLGSVFNDLIFEISNRFDNYQKAAKYAICNFLVKYRRIARNSSPLSNAEINYSRLIRLVPALKFISENYMTQIDLNQLASCCYISIATLRRDFVKNMGVSPLQYIANVRIKIAMSYLISSDLPIIKIAEKVGFQSLSSFMRTFKTITGCSPSNFRKERLPS